MKKISAIAAAILIALAVEVGSYFFLLMISFDQWEIPVLGGANHWLFSRSGLAAVIVLFIFAIWPTQRTRRNNIIRRKETHEPTQTKQ